MPVPRKRGGTCEYGKLLTSWSSLLLLILMRNVANRSGKPVTPRYCLLNEPYHSFSFEVNNSVVMSGDPEAPLIRLQRVQWVDIRTARRRSSPGKEEESNENSSVRFGRGSLSGFGSGPGNPRSGRYYQCPNQGSIEVRSP